MEVTMNIRKAKEDDLDGITKVYQACFPRERDHKRWIQASYSSYPRGVYYLVETKGEIAGYILWCVKNGFRDETIIELEQVGVHPNYSGQGLGRKLIEASLSEFKDHINKLGFSVGAIYVTTSEGHFAEGLYKSTLGVKRAALIEGYGSGNEVILYRQIESN
jgi:ribosomal protein S18 acetylase RimI-like enzyme